MRGSRQHKAGEGTRLHVLSGNTACYLQCACMLAKARVLSACAACTVAVFSHLEEHVHRMAVHGLEAFERPAHLLRRTSRQTGPCPGRLARPACGSGFATRPALGTPETTPVRHLTSGPHRTCRPMSSGSRLPWYGRCQELHWRGAHPAFKELLEPSMTCSWRHCTATSTSRWHIKPTSNRGPAHTKSCGAALCCADNSSVPGAALPQPFYAASYAPSTLAKQRYWLPTGCCTCKCGLACSLTTMHDIWVTSCCWHW